MKDFHCILIAKRRRRHSKEAKGEGDIQKKQKGEGDIQKKIQDEKHEIFNVYKYEEDELDKYVLKQFFSQAKCSFPFYVAEVYSEPCQKSKMERFAKIVTTLKLLINVAKKVHLRCSTGF